MDIETFITVGKVAGALLSIGALIAYLPKGYRWLRSWKIIKRKEFDRLTGIEAEYNKYVPAIEKQKEKAAEAVKEIHRQLERAQDRSHVRAESNRIRVNSEFDPRAQFKNWK
jgi:hypothetical protein